MSAAGEADRTLRNKQRLSGCFAHPPGSSASTVESTYPQAQVEREPGQQVHRPVDAGLCSPVSIGRARRVSARASPARWTSRAPADRAIRARTCPAGHCLGSCPAPPAPLGHGTTKAWHNETPPRTRQSLCVHKTTWRRASARNRSPGRQGQPPPASQRWVGLTEHVNGQRRLEAPNGGDVRLLQHQEHDQLEQQAALRDHERAPPVRPSCLASRGRTRRWPVPVAAPALARTPRELRPRLRGRRARRRVSPTEQPRLSS